MPAVCRKDTTNTVILAKKYKRVNGEFLTRAFLYEHFFSLIRVHAESLHTFNFPLERFLHIAYTVGMSTAGTKMIAQNKKARFNYTVTESLECGIELKGTEVKSVKAGNISFPDAFAEISNGEVWLKQLHISEYAFSSVFNHDPDRPKKLLLHRDEIKRLNRKVEEKGVTLIPLDFYLKNGRVKVNLGLCRGKKQYDKRSDIRERDIQRDMQRDFRKGLNG